MPFIGSKKKELEILPLKGIMNFLCRVGSLNNWGGGRKIIRPNPALIRGNFEIPSPLAFPPIFALANQDRTSPLPIRAKVFYKKTSRNAMLKKLFLLLFTFKGELDCWYFPCTLKHCLFPSISSGNHFLSNSRKHIRWLFRLGK